MPDAFTPNLGLVKPEIGSSIDTWGGKVNANSDTLDTAAIPVGGLLEFAGATAPARWLLCNGAVFAVGAYPKLFAVIGGTYGGDGVTTFAVPDCRARMSVGAGSTTDAGGLAISYTLGQRDGWFHYPIQVGHLPNYQLPISLGGEHTHPGATDSQGFHSHGAGIAPDGLHAHSLAGYHPVSGGPNTPVSQFPGWDYTAVTTDGGGTHTHAITILGDGNHAHNVAVYAAGSHDHVVTSGGAGVAFPTRPPIIAVNKIIYAGPP